MEATSPLLNQPPRTKRQAEIDRLCAELKHCEGKTDGDIGSVRLLLDHAMECARRHAESIPMSEHACENAEALMDFLNEADTDYLIPAEQSAKEYFDREEERHG